MTALFLTKKKEFKSLSEKRICMSDHDCKIFDCSFGYSEKRVKEFIREQKKIEENTPMRFFHCEKCEANFFKESDKLAGPKLT